MSENIKRAYTVFLDRGLKIEIRLGSLTGFTYIFEKESGICITVIPKMKKR